MRRVCFIVLVLVFVASAVFAGQMTIPIMSKTKMGKATSSVENSAYTGSGKKVSFFVTYAPSEATAGVTATVTASISYDGKTWIPAYWNDNDTATPTRVATKTLSTASYCGWFNVDQTIPYVTIRVNMANAAVYGAGENADVTVNVIEEN